MKYTSFLWDFDGTLFDSYPHLLAAFERIFTRDGIAYDRAELMAKMQISFNLVLREYGVSEEQYREILHIEATDAALRPMMMPYPGTAAVLRSVCEAGGRNFLYTHRDRSAWEYLRLFGLEKYFSGGVDHTMHFPLKPAPDAVNFICDRYGLDRETTVMIGDREIDVLSGVNGGIRGCLFVSHPVEEKTAASHRVTDMASLAAELEIPLREEDMLSDADADALREQARAAAEELCAQARLTAGQTVVIGCSTSEITGERIGTSSTPEAARAVLDGLLSVFRPRGIRVAAQCCEHLNRALIVERETALALGAEIVNVVPMPKAGGAFAHAAWQAFESPAAIRSIRADAGLDIGTTLIGMHLREVAVPLRLSANRIGQAAVTAARVRPPFVGGIRAVYSEELL